MRLYSALAMLTVCALAWPTPAGAQDVFIPRYDQPAAPAALETDRRLIRFLTSQDFPPLNFADADGEVIGFNVALAAALCDVLRTDCSMQAVPWAQLESRLLLGGGDVALAGHRVAGRRTPLIETRPYLANPARFVRRTEAPDAFDRVGVVEGSAHELYLERFSPTLQRVPFADLVTLETSLRTAEIDVAFLDAISAARLSADPRGGCCVMVPGAYTETRYFGEGLTMLLRRADGRLARQLEGAMTRLIDDGRFAELYLRYFPAGLY